MPRPAIFAIALAAMLLAFVMVRPRGSGTTPAVLERVDVVNDFDPVVTKPADTSRFTPPANIIVNDPAGENDEIVQSEVAIWVSGSEIVIGWNDGTVFDGGPSATGVGYSSDRGETWTDVGSPPTAEFLPFGDPTVVRTNAGIWLVASLNGSGGGGNLVQRAVSIGGVLSFTGSVAVGGAFADKEYLEYDPSIDTVYLSYTGTAGIEFTRSTDDGLTWSPPQTLAPEGVGAYPAVGVDGEVYVSWTTGLGSGSENFLVRHSPDGGVTFPDPARLITATQPGSAAPPACFNRPFNPIFPSCDVDRSSSPFRGRLYAVWSDGSATDEDVFLRHSDDDGATWSTPIALNDDVTSRQQYWPQVRVSEVDGRVLVGWFDRRHDEADEGLTDFYMTMSTAGGESFGPNRRASDTSVSWCGVPANISPNFGDYVDVAIDEWSSFLVFSDARLGGPDVVFARIDDRYLLDVAIAGTTGGIGGAGTAWLIPNATCTTISPAPVLETDAQLLALGTCKALLATPQALDGIFATAGEALSGAFTVTSFLGDMDVSVSLARTSPTEITLDLETTSDAGLTDLELPDAWRTRYTLTGTGPGEVVLEGATTVATPQGTVIFGLEGVLTLDGAPAVELETPFEVTTDVTRTAGGDLVVDTRTSVDTEITVAVEEPAPQVASTNPFPMATVRAAPNPLASDTAIRWATERATRGAIRIFGASGRLVRTLAERRFAAGEGSVPFDGKDDEGRALAPGAYFVRFETAFLAAGGKLLVLR